MKIRRNIFLVKAGFTLIMLLIISKLQGQLTAGISASVTEGCVSLEVTFSSTGTSGDSIVYDWDFGNGQSSNLSGAVVTYNDLGTYTVVLTVTDTINDNTELATVDITALQTAEFSLPSTWCADRYFTITFVGNVQQRDYIKWDFGDGNTSEEIQFGYNYAWDTNGAYLVEIISHTGACVDTFSKSITITGPQAEFSISKDTVCVDENLSFDVLNTEGVDSISWSFGDAGSSIDYSVEHSYSSWGDYAVNLKLIGPSVTCQLERNVHVVHLEAVIGYGNTAFCDGELVVFRSSSSFGATEQLWDFGNGETSINVIETKFLAVGEYNIWLKVADDRGCKPDTAFDTLTINPLPDVQIEDRLFVCSGDSTEIEVQGGDQISWFPITGLSSNSSYVVRAAPSENITYTATITDTNTNCVNTGSIAIVVQEIPDWPSSMDLLEFSDSSLYKGEEATIIADSINNYIYSWVDDGTISCLDCASITVKPLESKTYTLELSDTNNCFTNTYEVNFDVTEKYILGLPAAFTPDGRGPESGNIIKVEGLGIKNLLEFKIYNRRGREVFSTIDINEGWDGTLEGKKQDIGTYVYTIKAEMWDGRNIEKKGAFSLLR